VSSSEQAERIRSTPARNDLKPVETIEEVDVPGGAVLAKRPGPRVQAVAGKLAQLRDERDSARDLLDQLTAKDLPAISVTGDDWDELSHDDKRGSIQALIERADVLPGPGTERLRIRPCS
jgi:hypothetical protein